MNTWFVTTFWPVCDVIIHKIECNKCTINRNQYTGIIKQLLSIYPENLQPQVQRRMYKNLWSPDITEVALGNKDVIGLLTEKVLSIIQS